MIGVRVRVAGPTVRIAPSARGPRRVSSALRRRGDMATARTIACEQGLGAAEQHCHGISPLRRAGNPSRILTFGGPADPRKKGGHATIARAPSTLSTMGAPARRRVAQRAPHRLRVLPAKKLTWPTPLGNRGTDASLAPPAAGTAAGGASKVATVSWPQNLACARRRWSGRDQCRPPA